jgi:hypothetical protein
MNQQCETMQEEYQRLISQLGGKDIFLPKPILFRQTPHSRDVKISTIWINENVETFYGDGKFAVMQTLRLMVSRIQPNLFPACGSNYNDQFKIK